MTKVCQITTAHPRYDIRIFIKECSSLAKHYEVHLIVSDGKGDEVRNNVHIHDVGVNTKSRILRFLKIVYLSYKKAVQLDCALYHFHDPDFILAGVLLKWKGKKVIYDTHEDAPRQMLTKEYLGIFKRFVSSSFELVENWAARRYTAVITATPHIANRFRKLNSNTININNYPLLEEVTSTVSLKSELKIAYVGGLTKDKGLSELIDALEFMPVQLELAGEFESDSFKQKMMSKVGWEKVNYHGRLDRAGVLNLLEQCAAGMVVFNPTPNYINALPIKMFEYMAAGLPVVSSNFESWKEIIEGNQCGVCTDPMNPQDIASKTMEILNNPKAGLKMGENGIGAVREKFNWEIENANLSKVYKGIL